MANVRQIVSNGLAVGGLITMAASAVDAIAHNLLDQLKLEGQISAALREKYGIESKCTVGGGAWGGGASTCFDVVPGAATRQGEVKILAQYGQELDKQVKGIPGEARTERDGTVFISGGIALGARALLSQSEMKKGKQFTERMESRGGRRGERRF